MSESTAPVIFIESPTKDGKLVGRATLNAPKSINSLTMEMIQSLAAKLHEWRDRNDIVAVWLEGSGDKGFCAGGDIIKLYEAMQTKNYGYADSFFENEYSLDLCIHQFSKPIIVWGDGVVMGGGMGLMQGAKFRIVTERTMIAMPEITIGLYPDVGASYFLQKCPKPLGLFEALTGARLNATDALKMNFADYYIPSAHKDDLFAAILALHFKPSDSQNMMVLTDLLMNQSLKYSEQMPESQIDKHLPWIEDAFSHNKLNEIDAAIRLHHTDDKWLSRSLSSYLNGSPTSAKLTIEQLRRSREWSLDEAFRRELAISANFARSHDFCEGVRALLIDRDNKPAWNKKSINEVSIPEIAAYFEMPTGIKLELK